MSHIDYLMTTYTTLLLPMHSNLTQKSSCVCRFSYDSSILLCIVLFRTIT